MIARRRPARALLLHGAGGGGWEWETWRAVFAAHGVDSLAPDLRPAASGIAATGLADYRAQALQAAGTLGPHPLLVGASLGGLLALATAARVDCAALVLINPLPPWPEARELPPHTADALLPWRSLGRFEQTRRALPDADPAARLFAWRRWRDESGAVLAAARAGIELPAPACPMLVIASRDDDDVPCALSLRLARRLAATAWRIDGSHAGPLLGSGAAALARRAVGWLNCSG